MSSRASSTHSRTPATPGHRGARRWACLTIAALATTSLAACGSSSKPAYCADRSDLENSIKELPGFVTRADLDGLRTQTATIQTKVDTLASSAQSDFPAQTDAVGSAVRSLRSTVEALPSEPTAAQYARVGVQVTAAIRSVRNFSSATDSKCG